MEDLAGLDWQNSNATTDQKSSTANYYPSLRPTPPISGSSTPAIQGPFHPPKPLNGAPPRSNSSTPGNDSFANLVSFKGTAPNANLSLKERQKLLEEHKSQQTKQTTLSSKAVGTGDSTFWEQLGSGRSTPTSLVSPPAYAATSEYGGHKLSARLNQPFQAINKLSGTTKGSNGDDDLLSSFAGGADGPQSPSKSNGTANIRPSDHLNANLASSESKSLDQDTSELDDDPFGLGTNTQKKDIHESSAGGEAVEEDDILGLLGRPVSEFQAKTTTQPAPMRQTDLEASHPQDRALAELVEMGFSTERSREALESTESGTDVQAAVGWLLNQAHQESRKKSEVTQDTRDGSHVRKGRRRSSSPRTDPASPAWAQPEERPQDPHRHSSRSPANGERDPSRIAAELGNNLFKTANSLWKTSTKKLNQAVAELNSDSDSSQPKWMRAAKPESGDQTRRAQKGMDEADDLDRRAVRAMQRAASKENGASVTDEALMLESAAARPARKAPSRSKPEVSTLSHDSSRTQSPVMDTRPQDRVVRPLWSTQQPSSSDPKSRVSKQVIEEQASEAYISPARRKKTTPKPPAQPKPIYPESDLLFEASQQSKPQASISRSQSQPHTTSHNPTTTALSTRSPPPKRTYPTLSPSALQNYTRYRSAGTAAFKRGDYAEATTNFTGALSILPQTHPLTIPLLTNRALSQSKTGDPKASISDANTALELIGPSRGVSESIDLGDEGSKEMSIFWGKAMTRKAEALEHLERWSDAAGVWKVCVEAGVGGAHSIAGRNRCEKAARPPATKAPTLKRPPPKPKPRTTALDDLAGRPTVVSTQSAEAVSRLRAANQEAERVDDEKFALSDSVSERLQTWRAGKEGNLRALLASLETVLWEGAGWKKIGMAEVIQPGKVKVQYMKGIAKVHPDKVRIP